MAMYTNGSTLGVTKTEMFIIQKMAEGWDVAKIAEYAYDCTDGNGVLDDKKFKKAKANVRKLLRNPKVINAYKEILKEYTTPMIADAMRLLGKQVREEEGWLANKAANDILTRLMPDVFGEADKKVVVQIEGMPKLGTPDGDE